MSEEKVQYGKANLFQKATKKQARLRMAIDGPSGSGKTYTALTFATALANGGRVAVIDTERGSASLYADEFDFDVLELSEFSPEAYTEGIKAAESAGYDVIVLDSLSHAWEGKGGILEIHDKETSRNRSGNSWTAWREVTPRHRALVDAILQSKGHVIATMRSKMDYIQTTENGKTKIKKVGLAPIQRQGMEYEFTIVADMDVDHNMIVSKSRCKIVADDVVKKPGADWMAKVRVWLESGEAVVIEDAPTQSDTNNMTAEVSEEPPIEVVPDGDTWVDQKRERAAFGAWLKEQGIETRDALTAMRVSTLRGWGKSLEETKALILAWRKAQLDAEDAERVAEPVEQAAF